MPRVMTVDDSRSVRTIIVKQLQAMGCEIDEAEDGKQALEKLQDIAVDLILLDVTMPVMDGPTMLTELRAAGNKTPVIMLTSESKRSVIADAMKQGIDDYILKPFKPEELVAKVKKSLKNATVPAGDAAIVDTGASKAPAAVAAAPSATSTEGKQFVDILVVDDMENVIKRLRSLVPEHVTIQGVTSAQAALAACRDKVFRVALVDYELPDVNIGLLISQLKMLQPHAAMVAMVVKSPAPLGEVSTQVKGNGFSDLLLKPFAQETVEDFILQFFDRQDMLSREDNILKVSSFSGRADRVDRYFSRLKSLIDPALETIASACFEGVVVDLTKAPAASDKLPKLIVGVGEKAKEMGLRLCLVGTPEVRSMLKMYEETKSLAFYGAVAEARAEVG